MREADKESKKSMMQAAYASTFGIALVLGIFGGILIGAWLDRLLDTGHKFSILFLLVGVFAGFRSLYVWIKNTFEDSYEEPIIRRLKDEPHRKRPPAKKN
ncbi:MAG: AtpZ/AtpI family protein [Syntrophaceae bacterium]|nr:AtpZ/AtpI family protein [Syntrophaceae bacterium]